MSGVFRPGFWRRSPSPEVPSKAGPQAPPAPALPQARPVPADPVAAEAEMLIEELRQATRAAGVGRDDPMMPLLHSFARTIRFFGNRTAGSDRAMAEAIQRIVDALTLAQTTADAERKQFEAALATAQARTISEVSLAIAESAEAALARRVRVFDRNTALVAAAVFVVAAGTCLWGGYRWGSSSVLADVHQTEAGLRAAFNAGPADAATWMSLMEWNHIRAELDICAKSGASFMQEGRKACPVPLWVEPPKPTAPR